MMRAVKNALFCGLCFILSSFLGLTLVFGKHESFSEKENRSLQLFPTIDFSSLSDGSFFADLNEFCSDQFPLRNIFCSVSTACDLALGRLESNGVIVASDGYTVSRHDYVSNSILKRNAEAINSFFAYTEESSIPSHILLAPRAIDVMTSKLPSLFPRKYTDTAYETLKEIIYTDHLIDTSEMLRASADRGNYVWYKTDHHWTTQGAYEVYSHLFDKLGEEVFPPDSFNIECVSDDFYGTTHSKLSLPYAESDSIYLFRYDEDEKTSLYFPTTDKTMLGFYYPDALNTKDKYSIFLGGNSDLLQIRSLGGSREKILLIKDSFANSLIPFLARHYDMDVIDLRYYKQSLRDYISENEFSSILLVYGIDTLATDPSAILLSK